VRRDIGRGLRVPAFLAVTAIGAAPACTPDDKPTTESSSSGATGSSSSASSGGTTMASTTTVTGTDTAGTTGGFPDCKAIKDEPTCEATANCVWPPELLYCILDCEVIKDPMTCAENSPCTWFEEKCQLLLI
jgi:hypothetical protein